jgi:hypothetical protein
LSFQLTNQRVIAKILDLNGFFFGEAKMEFYFNNNETWLAQGVSTKATIAS